MNNVNILITGINGFIATSLKHYIKKKCPYWKVYGIDKKAKKSKTNFKFGLENKNRLKKILFSLKPKYIFHFCGDAASKDLKKLLFTNVYITSVLFAAIKEIENYNPRIIIPSSAAEYGKFNLLNKPFREDSPLKPVSLYGFSKLAQTMLSLMFAEKRLDIVIARLFNVAGEGATVNFSVGKFAYELALIKKKKKKPVIYTKNLDTKRDFLDITDVCRYLVGVAIYGKKAEVYNICRGKSYKIRKLFNKLIKISGIRNIKIIEDKEYDKETDLADSFGSTKKIKKVAGSPVLVSIDKSLRNTYFYYLSKV